MEVRSIEAILRALEQAHAKYLIVGGLAVNAHGYQRATADLDLVVGLSPDNIMPALRGLQALGYRPAVPVTPEQFANKALREKWRHEKNMAVLKLWSDAHRSTPVDIFAYEPFDLQQEIAAALWQEVAPGLKAPIVRLETLLGMKRSAGRLQDLADLEALDEIRKMRDNPER